MSEPTKDLDAALEAEEKAAQLRAENPDAPQELIETSIENTKRLAELKRRTEELKQTLGAFRQRRRNAVRYALERPLLENKARLAAIADDAGIATEEEKEFLTKISGAADGQDGNLDGLAASLGTTNADDTPDQ